MCDEINAGKSRNVYTYTDEKGERVTIKDDGGERTKSIFHKNGKTETYKMAEYYVPSGNGTIDFTQVGNTVAENVRRKAGLVSKKEDSLNAYEFIPLPRVGSVVEY